MRILFVCKSNVVRSQMSEAFHNKVRPQDIVDSVGSVVSEERKGFPIGEIPEAYNAIQVMKEKNIDISDKRIKSLDDFENKLLEYDKIIIMTKSVSWQGFFSDNNPVAYWEVEDPKGKDLDFNRKIRDEIFIKVKELIKNLNK